MTFLHKKMTQEIITSANIIQLICYEYRFSSETNYIKAYKRQTISNMCFPCQFIYMQAVALWLNYSTSKVTDSSLVSARLLPLGS